MEMMGLSNRERYYTSSIINPADCIYLSTCIEMRSLNHLFILYAFRFVRLSAVFTYPSANSQMGKSKTLEIGQHLIAA
jgi:hypothetical protein